MELKKLIKNSWQVATSRPGLWLAAAIQLAAVFALSVKLEGLFARPSGGLGAVWLLSLLFFSLSTVWGWVVIQNAYIESRGQEKKIRPFKWERAVQLFVLSLAVFLAMYIGRLYEIGWVTVIVIGALLLPTALVAALGIVLLNLSFKRALRLSMDFWSLRSVVPAVAGAVFMLLHAWAFALARQAYGFIGIWQGFSESAGFGTIWSLALWLGLGVGIFGAFFNTFIVFGFLEVMASKNSGLKKVEEIPKPLPVVQ